MSKSYSRLPLVRPGKLYRSFVFGYDVMYRDPTVMPVSCQHRDNFVGYPAHALPALEMDQKIGQDKPVAVR